jgi:hypothetical protein
VRNTGATRVTPALVLLLILALFIQVCKSTELIVDDFTHDTSQIWQRAFECRRVHGVIFFLCCPSGILMKSFSEETSNDTQVLQQHWTNTSISLGQLGRCRKARNERNLDYAWPLSMMIRRPNLLVTTTLRDAAYIKAEF